MGIIYIPFYSAVFTLPVIEGNSSVEYYLITWFIGLMISIIGSLGLLALGIVLLSITSYILYGNFEWFELAIKIKEYDFFKKIKKLFY